MITRSKTTDKFIAIPLRDLGEMVSVFIQDAGRNNIEDPGAITEAFDGITALLNDGFKKETYKGQLFYALHHALRDIRDAVASCGEDQTEIQLNTHSLALLNTSYIQLGEAALQYGGSKNIPSQLRWAFSNNGHGHGPDGQKYKANLLREMVNESIPAFFEKHKAGFLSDQALEFYAPQSAPGRVM